MIYNWSRLELELRNNYGNKYVYFEKDYLNTTTKVNIKCNDCGKIFEETIQRHLKGKRCPNCFPLINNKGKKLSLEEVKIKLNNTKPYYDYDISTYIKMSEPMKFFCPHHNEFWQRPNLRISQNQRCPKCAKENPNKNRLLSLDEVKRVLDTQPIFYEYNINTFSGVLNKMKFICPVHGEFEQSYLNRSMNKKCLKCSRIEQPIKKRYSLDKVKLKLNQKHNFEPDMETYQSINEPMKFICKKHGEFWQRPNLQFTQNHGCPKCSLNKIEIEIIEEFGHNFEIHNRLIIKPFEIDFFDSKLNFGIEYNGVAFHSFGKHKHEKFNNFHKLDKNKHLNKTMSMEKQGYQLFHIQSIHWNTPVKKEIWKSIINNKLNRSYKLYARKLKIIDLTNHKQFVKDFLNTNHLQGSCGYRYAYGLCNEKYEVYSIMTFGKSRFNKNYEYELLRFCNIKNTSIIGGASKLLKHFERTIKPISIISYANRDWSQGNLYKQIGFEFIGSTPPNYFYIDINENIISRISAQKHKLKNLLNENFNENISEIENMINAGYRIYYDTGNLKFSKISRKEN